MTMSIDALSSQVIDTSPKSKFAICPTNCNTQLHTPPLTTSNCHLLLNLEGFLTSHTSLFPMQIMTLISCPSNRNGLNQRIHKTFGFLSSHPCFSQYMDIEHDRQIRTRRAPQYQQSFCHRDEISGFFSFEVHTATSILILLYFSPPLRARSTPILQHTDLGFPQSKLMPQYGCSSDELETSRPHCGPAPRPSCNIESGFLSSKVYTATSVLILQHSFRNGLPWYLGEIARPSMNSLNTA